MTNEEKMAKAVAQRVEGITTRVAGERYTKFLEMYLPGENNYYRVEEDQNKNFEKIDGALENAQRMAIDLFSKKQDKEDNKLSTNDKTVVGAINETQSYTDGLAGLQGENSFPLSKATEGQVYKEPNSKKYYVCIKNYSGRLITVPNGNFESFSVNRNKERLDFEKTLTIGSGVTLTVFEKIAFLQIKWIEVDKYKTFATIPLEYAPKIRLHQPCSLSEFIGGTFGEKHGVIFIDTTGEVSVYDGLKGVPGTATVEPLEIVYAF